MFTGYSRRLALAAVSLFSLVLSSATPALCAHQDGGINFPRNDKQALPVNINGTYMSLEGKVWSAEKGGLGGGQHLRFEAKIKNTSKYTTFYSVYIAFFDSKWNMIACEGGTQIFGQEPGKVDSHGADLYIPKSELAKISAYQITFFDDAAQIGKQ